MFKSHALHNINRLALRTLLGFMAVCLYLSSTNSLAQFSSHYRAQENINHQQAINAMSLGNYAIAYCLWQPLAEEGNREAQYNIGWMYHNGYGLSIDDEMALYWWLQAASLGSADAHFALGDLYANGEGVRKNLAIAMGWYISASLMGHDSAKETLRTMLGNNDELAINTFKILLKTDWSILGDTLEVGVDKANARRGPDKSYKILTTLERGHAVIPLKQQSGWTYIGITGRGTTAWIFSKLLIKPSGIYAADEVEVIN